VQHLRDRCGCSRFRCCAPYTSTCSRARYSPVTAH